MRRIKVANRCEVLKDRERILSSLERRIKGIVVDILTGVEMNLGEELHGIGLEVMRAVMEFEIADIAGPKGKHLNERAYSRWGHNPG